MAEPIEMLCELCTEVGPRKHVWHGVHIGTTWQIRMNHPCSAALQKWLHPSRCCLGCGLR